MSRDPDPESQARLRRKDVLGHGRAFRSVAEGFESHYISFSCLKFNRDPRCCQGVSPLGIASPTTLEPAKKKWLLFALIEAKDPLPVFVPFIALEINLDQLNSVRIFKIRIYQS
jgi:hypothetical protein